jgi:hypothetical protein
MSIRRNCRPLAGRSAASGLLAALLAIAPAATLLGGQSESTLGAPSLRLIDRLNQPWQRVSEANKSWRPIMTAVLDVTPAPFEIGPRFDFTGIWPGMQGWSEVAAWAERNEALGRALLAEQNKLVFGFPYGDHRVDPIFRAKDYAVTIDIDGEDKRTTFGYLRAISIVNAWATAEMYRLAEAGRFEEAFAIGLAHLRLLRQVADQIMLEETLFAFNAMSDSFSVQRDLIWTYLDRIPAELLRRLGTKDYPFLRPADNEKLRRLEMPEGDRMVAEAILEQCFDENGQPDAALFAEVFAGLQSADAPLTRFGAARRWGLIAEVHGSLDASRKKLYDVYDDWWRRWRMKPYEPIMAIPTELSRLNPVRYAAVVLSVKDIEQLFKARRRLAAEFAGTVVSAGLAAYRRGFGTWADDRAKAYTQFFPKRFDSDPYDRQYGRFLYRFVGSDRRPVETVWGRIFVDGGILYARNEDHNDDGFRSHEPGGDSGDFILWPPPRALARQQTGG